MCRWFAYISDLEPCLLDDVLVRPAHSIVKQVEEHYLPGLFHHTTKEEDEAQRREIKTRNLYFNGDGTGVAFYSTVASEFGEASYPLPQIYKQIIPPKLDVNLKSLLMNSTSHTVFAHVRMATSQVQQSNCHPFAFGRHILMHNGSVANFSQIRRELCSKLLSSSAFDNIQGSTDSEHVAALYMTHLGDDWNAEYSLEQMKAALERAIADIIKLQKALPGATSPLAASSLNLCTTDGSKLLAFRFRNSDIEEPPSLYYSTRAGITLNRKYPGHPDFTRDVDPGTSARGLVGDNMLPPEKHGDHVIVSSEPTTRDKDEWTLVPKNQAVLVNFVKGQTNLRLENINVVSD